MTSSGNQITRGRAPLSREANVNVKKPTSMFLPSNRKPRASLAVLSSTVFPFKQQPYSIMSKNFSIFFTSLLLQVVGANALNAVALQYFDLTDGCQTTGNKFGSRLTIECSNEAILEEMGCNFISNLDGSQETLDCGGPCGLGLFCQFKFEGELTASKASSRPADDEDKRFHPHKLLSSGSTWFRLDEVLGTSSTASTLYVQELLQIKACTISSYNVGFTISCSNATISDIYCETKPTKDGLEAHLSCKGLCGLGLYCHFEMDVTSVLPGPTRGTEVEHPQSVLNAFGFLFSVLFKLTGFAKEKGELPWYLTPYYLPYVTLFLFVVFQALVLKLWNRKLQKENATLHSAVSALQRHNIACQCEILRLNGNMPPPPQF